MERLESFVIRCSLGFSTLGSTPKVLQCSAGEVPMRDFLARETGRQARLHTLGLLAQVDVGTRVNKGIQD
ncbi:hypothetical protein NDU88_006485 [Pleurodeles waltl]|uniref:Uncharacterized protein n=1 Tax=Pleurodeles waltl TaxID=8319 RepID=A0AAV7N2I2_PLEWA|nr:hypothetical protein NDU88_006485 [Pleurodeles waltl]